jgi:thiol-disulfide isomerase/thioredoxin
MPKSVTKARTLASMLFCSLLFAGCTATGPTAQTPEQEDQKMAASVPTATTPSTMEGKSMTAGAPKQISFVSEAAAQTEAKTGPTVYFFKASWCPTCQAAQKDFDSNLSSLPKGTTIVTADYDKEKALKTKYGITTQHTFVQIDADGSVLSKWNGGATAELLKNIQQ